MRSRESPLPPHSGHFIAMDGGVPRGLAMALGEPFVTATMEGARQRPAVLR